MKKTFESSFSPIDFETWLEELTRELKGKSAESLHFETLDGIKIKPFYLRQDRPASALMDASRRSDKHTNAWANREQIRAKNPKEANQQALNALAYGVPQLTFLTYPAGVEAHDQATFRQLLDGIHLGAVELHWNSGPFSPHTFAMLLNEAERQGVAFGELKGSIDHDPILDAAAGWTQVGLRDWQPRCASLIDAQLHTTPAFQVLTIRGSQLEKAGASVAQELALSMALFMEYLTGLADEHVPIDQLVERTEFRYAVGTQYFLEIAKLRAHRILLANVLSSYGLPTSGPKLHVETTSTNKTLYDPTNNLIRATIESMAAIAGGADSLTVSAFDQTYQTPDEFSNHLARNTENLLLYEAYLDKVVDPMGGSYYLENLTEQLAEQAWGILKDIEERGGFVAAWESGYIPSQITDTRTRKQERYLKRKVPVIGTTLHPNPREARLGVIQRLSTRKAVRHWSEEESYLGDLRRFFSNGQSMHDWETEMEIPETPLSSFRPIRPFEELRLRAERHPSKLVLPIIPWSNSKLTRARIAFCKEVLNIAGISAEVMAPFASDAAAVAWLNTEKTPIAIFCAEDEEYDNWSQHLASTSTALIFAGRPGEIAKAQAHSLIFAGMNVHDFLAHLMNSMGVSQEAQ